jgi:hypothetical protein
VPEIPITLRCECGQAHSVELGDQVQCSCGRSYDTRTLDQARLVRVRRSQAKMRLYITFGLIFIVGISLTTFAVWGLKGVAIGLPASAIAWFRLIGPVVRRRVFYGAGELPTWQLESTKTEAEPEH